MFHIPGKPPSEACAAQVQPPVPRLRRTSPGNTPFILRLYQGYTMLYHGQS
jgi:hypothetical protein